MILYYCTQTVTREPFDFYSNRQQSDLLLSTEIKTTYLPARHDYVA